MKVQAASEVATDKALLSAAESEARREAASNAVADLQRTVAGLRRQVDAAQASAAARDADEHSAVQLCERVSALECEVEKRDAVIEAGRSRHETAKRKQSELERKLADSNGGKRARELADELSVVRVSGGEPVCLFALN